VLILLPPSETKAVVRRGKPLDPAALSFPSLAPVRAAVLAGLIEASGRDDAMARLGVGASLEELVRRNVALAELPTATAEAVYSGVLYDALDAGSLTGSARRRARSWIVVVSALWGAVRLGDRIPPYRLSMCGRLPGLPPLGGLWRPALASVLPAAAGRGLIVDCRSSDYAAAWRPDGELAARTVAVKVVREVGGQRSAVSHNAKHTRGLVARTIVSTGLDVRRPEALAEGLSSVYELDLRPPARPGRTWELSVVEPGA
jgi:cytoplasmic iron level regulating protein YaaA (DUF328/UPF0246 family)